MDERLIASLKRLRASEKGPGVHRRDAAVRAALVYPSEYRAAMSSLGFLEVHRRLNARSGTVAERAFLPSPRDVELHHASNTPLLTIESLRPVGEFDVVGISQAYELELSGVVRALELSKIAPLASERGPSDPLVVLGGPITFSNPLPAVPFADVLILGEAEGCLSQLFDRIEERPEAARGSEEARASLLAELAELDGFYVPSVHGDWLPPIAKADDAVLPAVSQIWTPNTVLHDMTLIEPARGCHRGCTFCVMRRSTNGGMRLIPPDRVLELIPKEVPRVGLVGAAVTDHPKIKDILRGLVREQNKSVGISSLRADRLDDEFVALLAEGGYRSMTVALDAASARLRDQIEKNLKDRAVERAVELAKAHGMRHLKIYVVVGLEGETDEDLFELLEFSRRLSTVLPVKLSVSPLVPKFHTPLAMSDFAGERRAGEIIRLLKRHAPPQVEVGGPSAREAYVEYRLAQGGPEHHVAALFAARRGGALSAWKKALAELPERHRPANFQDLVPAATLRRRWHAKQAADLGAA